MKDRLWQTGSSNGLSLSTRYDDTIAVASRSFFFSLHFLAATSIFGTFTSRSAFIFCSCFITSLAFAKARCQMGSASLSRWLWTGIYLAGFLVLLVLAKRMGRMVGLDGWEFFHFAHDVMTVTNEHWHFLLDLF